MSQCLNGYNTYSSFQVFGGGVRAFNDWLNLSILDHYIDHGYNHHGIIMVYIYIYIMIYVYTMQ